MINQSISNKIKLDQNSSWKFGIWNLELEQLCVGQYLTSPDVFWHIATANKI